MRKFILLASVIFTLAVLHATAQQNDAKSGYKIDFKDDSEHVSRLDESPEGEKGIFFQLKFYITLDGKRVESLDGDYKVIVKENNKVVREVTLPRTAAEALSVMMALDTSGSMEGHGRMEQARGAAEAFLGKLPKLCDCGLILFDHEIREKLPPERSRDPLLNLINTTKPRGGTAYIDAAYEGIQMLRTAARGRKRAVVLITDGIDLNSNRPIDEVIKLAKREQAPVYTVGIGEKGKLQQVNTVLVLDHSGSMKPPADEKDDISKIEALHLAGQRYVSSISATGRVSIIPFSTYVGRPQPFRGKSDLDTLKERIKSLKPTGETALLDAIYEGINTLETDNQPGKRAVIAMTDGIDNTSRRRVEEVIARAEESGIPVYLLGFGKADELDETTMRLIADKTKGQYFHAKNKDSLITIFEKLSIDLHDDGIDEESLKRIAKETGGQYYHAKDLNKLKEIFQQVVVDIKPMEREVTFKSLIQRAGGEQRNFTLELADAATGAVVDTAKGTKFVRGLVVAEMHPFIYLLLLVGVGALIALPGLLRRSPAA